MSPRRHDSVCPCRSPSAEDVDLVIDGIPARTPAQRATAQRSSTRRALARLCTRSVERPPAPLVLSRPLHIRYRPLNLIPPLRLERLQHEWVQFYLHLRSPWSGSLQEESRFMAMFPTRQERPTGAICVAGSCPACRRLRCEPAAKGTRLRRGHLFRSMGF